VTKTPEGKVKEKIRGVLQKYGAYYFQPVQMGIGAAGLDFHCTIACGEFALAFFVEAKEEGKHVTPRQAHFIEEREKQKCKCFIVDNDVTLRELDRWLYGMTGDYYKIVLEVTQ
jgi:hypothetical protein